MLVIKHHSYYQGCNTRNRWCSVDTHFQDGVGSISLSLLAIKAANTSFMTVCNLSPPRTPKIHHHQLLTLLWRSFIKMWYGACLCSFWALRWPIHQKHTGPYQCQYFTINSSISECNHKCGTQNATSGIRTDGSSQTVQNTRVDGYGSKIGPQRVIRSSFWLVRTQLTRVCGPNLNCWQVTRTRCQH